MTSYPKPSHRGRKPPKRIERHIRPHSLRAGKLAALKREAGALWSKLVRQRAGDRCEVLVLGLFGRCPFVATDAAHIFSKRRERLRYNLDNGLALCAEHHELLGNAIVGRRTRMGDCVKVLRGVAFYERLEALAEQHWKFEPQTLAALKAQARLGWSKATIRNIDSELSHFLFPLAIARRNSKTSQPTRNH